MTRPWKTCSRPSRRAGLTLVEVVAAIAILGTILVGAVIARSRHMRQLALAERKGQAITAADELIAGWYARPEGVPIDQAGRIETADDLSWRTRQVENGPIDRLGARVVRVEILQGRQDQDAGPRAGKVLVTVDIVLPQRARRAELRAERQPGGRP